MATIILIAITVTMVAAASLSFDQASSRPSTSEIRLDMHLFAQAGRTSVSLLHDGGSRLDAGELRAVVTVNDTVWFDGPAGTAGSPWDVGDVLQVGALPQALPSGARVEASIVSRAAGSILATASGQAATPPRPVDAAAPGFAVDLRIERSSQSVVVEPPAGLLVEAAVEHPAGRKFIRFVYADFRGFDGVDWQELRDDGTHGDRVTGDGIYSAVTLVPINTTSGEAKVRATAVDFNGRRASDEETVTILVRDEVTEQMLNPYGSPLSNLTSTCPAGTAAVTSTAYEIGGTLASRLAGNVRQGDHVKAVVTLARGCNGTDLTLAAYRAPGPVFSWRSAEDQLLDDVDTKVATSRQLVLEVDVPSCYFAIYLVRGPPLPGFGPEGTNNYYSRQGRLIDSDNGGTMAC